MPGSPPKNVRATPGSNEVLSKMPAPKRAPVLVLKWLDRGLANRFSQAVITLIAHLGDLAH
jgi:hypothetical protein